MKGSVKITRGQTSTGISVAEVTQGRSKMSLLPPELKRLQDALTVYRSNEEAGIQAVEVTPEGDLILSGSREFFAGMGAVPDPQPPAKPPQNPIPTPGELGASVAAETGKCKTAQTTKKKSS